jgi:hypothetical protein
VETTHASHLPKTGQQALKDKQEATIFQRRHNYLSMEINPMRDLNLNTHESPKLPMQLILLSFLVCLPLKSALADPNFTDNGDGTVTDNRTSLTWKRCAENQAWTGATCAGDQVLFLADDAFKIASNFAGHNDWRVPTIEELRSSLPYADELFPNQPYSYVYWSSTSYEWLSGLFMLKTMQFGNPSVVSSGVWKGNYDISIYKNNLTRAAVRLVRGSKVIDHRDGTYTNKATLNLMWKVCPEGMAYTGKPFIALNVTGQSLCTGSALTYNWPDGVQAARSGAFKSNFAGYSDWRLPTMAELKTDTSNPTDFLNAVAYEPYNILTDPDGLLYGISVSSGSVTGIYLGKQRFVGLVRTVSATNLIPTSTPGLVRDALVGLYITYFNCAPDKSGLAYWEAQAAANGATQALNAISSAFAQSPVATNQYPSNMTDDQFVNQMYQYALGVSAPDAGGKAYWTGRLASGASRSQLMVEFINAVLGYNAATDNNSTATEKQAAVDAQAMVKNKISAGTYFAIDSSGPAEKTNVPLAGNGNPDTQSAQYLASIEVLIGVTKDPATVNAAYVKAQGYKNSLP